MQELIERLYDGDSYVVPELLKINNLQNTKAGIEKLGKIIAEYQLKRPVAIEIQGPFENEQGEQLQNITDYLTLIKSI